MPPVVGLLSTSSGQRIWPPEEIARARQFLDEAGRVLESLGFGVVKHEEIVCNAEEGVAAGREIRSGGADVLVCYIGGWSYSTGVVAAAAEAGLPVILWTNSRPDTAGLVGAGIAKGALDEVGLDHEFVYGESDEPEIRRQLASLVAGLGLRSRMARSKFGLLGNRTIGMYTTAIDVNQWKRQFGVEVECIDQVDLVERARAADPGVVREAAAWMAQTFGSVQVAGDVLDRSLRLYLAMLELIREHSLDFAAVRCLPELSRYYATFCVANALLNDSRDFRGDKDTFVNACEADGNAALTMQMLKLLAGGPVNFGDVRYIDRKSGVLVVCNCGSQALGLAKSPQDVHWLPQLGFQGEGGGACSQYVCKPGLVTLARLSRVRGEYVMLIEKGECLDVPRERLRETTWEWPHAFIKLSSDYRNFLKHDRSNHIHTVYGDVAAELEVACRAMNVRPIVLGAPGGC